MNNVQTLTLTSERLRLVPVSEEHAEGIFKEFTDEITAYMYPKTPQSIEETLEFVRKTKEKREKAQEINFAILRKDTQEFLGCGGISKMDTTTPELGIWIKKSAHGNKYGKEAVTAIKEWTDKNLTYDYIAYPVDKKNIASRKIAESLGGVVKAAYKKTNMAGRVLDEVEYRIYPKTEMQI